MVYEGDFGFELIEFLEGGVFVEGGQDGIVVEQGFVGIEVELFAGGFEKFGVRDG